MPEIEKEVKRLFRMDNEAIDVKWEVVVEDEKSSQDHTSTQIMHGEVIHDVKPTASNMELCRCFTFTSISKLQKDISSFKFFIFIVFSLCVLFTNP